MTIPFFPPLARAIGLSPAPASSGTCINIYSTPDGYCFAELEVDGITVRITRVEDNKLRLFTPGELDDFLSGDLPRVCNMIGVPINRRQADPSNYIPDCGSFSMTEMQHWISVRQLAALKRHLDAYFEGGGECEGDFSECRSFLTSHDISTAPVLNWFETRGGHCDCEVLANVFSHDDIYDAIEAVNSASDTESN